MLDQHLAHVGVGERRIDGLLRVGQKFFFGGTKVFVAAVRAVDHLAQGVQHGGQIGLELYDGSAKAGDLGALVVKEKPEQFFECGGVVHRAAHHLLPVLPKHNGGVVAEDDVVLRIAFPELLGDLLIEVISRVLGLPVTQGHAQLVQQGAIHVDVGFGGRLERVFGQKDQIVLTAPCLEQVLEGFADDGFALATADLLDEIELVEVVLDEKLVRGLRGLWTRHYGQPRSATSVERRAATCRRRRRRGREVAAIVPAHPPAHSCAR